MRKAVYTSEKSGRLINWKAYYLECENAKSNLVFYAGDLQFLRNLLDTHFEEMAKNGNLDEMRESLIRFQDLCYNYDHLKKRVKDQQSNLINGSLKINPDMLILEQTEIENKMVQLTKDFRIVEKEMLSIADHLLGIKNEGEISNYE
jgi:hypothetical protein